MKPAVSIIFFTVSSGAGLGLLALIALCDTLASGSLPAEALWRGALLGLALVAVGLASSVLHLANPKNAWRAAALGDRLRLCGTVRPLPLRRRGIRSRCAGGQARLLARDRRRCAGADPRARDWGARGGARAGADLRRPRAPARRRPFARYISHQRIRLRAGATARADLARRGARA